MADNWYAVVDGAQAGPFSPEEMRRLWDERRIDNATLVWKEGMENWVPAGEANLPGGSHTSHAAPGAVAVGNTSLQGAPFQLAVRRFFNGYVIFNGRASRSEFWWPALFNIGAGILLGIVDAMLFGSGMQNGGPLSGLYSLATFLPNIAVSVRRLHDIDRSGWWILLLLVPVIGWIVLLVFFCTASSSGSNRFGDTTTV